MKKKKKKKKRQLRLQTKGQGFSHQVITMIFAEFCKEPCLLCTCPNRTYTAKNFASITSPKIRGKSDGSLRRFVDVGSRIMIIKNGCLLRAAITSHRLKFQTLFTRSEYHLDYLCFVTEK